MAEQLGEYINIPTTDIPNQARGGERFSWKRALLKAAGVASVALLVAAGLSVALQNPMVFELGKVSAVILAAGVVLAETINTN